MRWMALMAVWAGGCSFSVDPVVVTSNPDLAVADLAVPPGDDLPLVLDLTMENPDLVSPSPMPDLLMKPDLTTCSPPLFPGFSPGVSDPFDCTKCGCSLDDFSSDSDARWSRAPSLGWSNLIGGGTLTVTGTNIDNKTGDTLSSGGHFYLSGDFDLLVDYKITSWPSGGGFTLLAQGPPLDGGADDDVAISHTYTIGGTNHYYLVIGAQPPSDVVFGAMAGTFEITRTGGTVCAANVGHTPRCGTVTESGPLGVQLAASVSSSTCASNCSFSAQFSSPRLKSGTIVSTQ